MAAAPVARLESWKQIAAYLKRSVRTVRRWERDEGLPVHRHMHRSLASVFALRSEIDAWRSSATRGPQRYPAGAREPESIAVLPFANLCAEAQANAYFVDGLTEEVATTLSRLSGLRVIARSSAAALRDTRHGAPAIARQLGVRYLLLGSVRRDGGQLRISAQLVDAAHDRQLWGESFTGALQDVFTFQERLAGLIVTALKVHLTPGETRQLAERDIPSVAAYEYYLRARHAAWRWRRDSIEQSLGLLQEGLRLVGDNARLYAALGFAHLQLREAGIDLSEAPLREAERCVTRVLELAPDSAAGLQLRGWLHYSRGRVQEAVRDLKAALTREPHNADTLLLLCNCYLISGQVAAARPLLATLQAVDPLTPITRCMPAFADIMSGNLAAALSPYRLMLDMDPGNPMARLFCIWVLLLNGRRAAARSLLSGFPRVTRSTLPARMAHFLVRAAATGRRTGRLSVTAELAAAARATDLFPRFLAQAFALARRREPALRWLQIAIERGFINYPFLARHDPCFRTLRADPGFRALLSVVRERWRHFET